MNFHPLAPAGGHCCVWGAHVAEEIPRELWAGKDRAERQKRSAAWQRPSKHRYQQSGNASVSSESFTYAGKGLHLSDNALEVHNSSADL